MGCSVFARGDFVNQLSLTEIVLWAAGFVVNAALLLVLLLKRRDRIVPCFTVWIGWGVLTTISLYIGRTHGSRHLYAVLYWTAAFVDLLLQLSVVGELAKLVFRRGDTWLHSAKVRLAAGSSAVVLIAAVLAFTATPAASSAKDALYSRISLFETVLFTGVILAVVAVSQQLGAGWQDLVIREGLGFLLLNLISFVTDTLHVYWRTAEHFGDLEHLRMGVYLVTLGYWIKIFWLPERGEKVVDERTKKDLEKLRSQLQSVRYDGPRRGDES